jgi:class 3 adenylate cyclase
MRGENETLSALGDFVEARELDLLQVKGKEMPVRIFELGRPQGRTRRYS